LLKEFGIKPYEIELIPIEDMNALWTLYEYELERKNMMHLKRRLKSK